MWWVVVNTWCSNTHDGNGCKKSTIQFFQTAALECIASSLHGEEFASALLSSYAGGSEIRGPWANYVDQDNTSLKNLYNLILLYLEAAIKWLETEYGTNFDTKAEVGPVKLLSIRPDFVTATGTVQRSAGRGAKIHHF